MIVAWDFDGVLNKSVVNGRFVWADAFLAEFGQPDTAFGAFVFIRAPRVLSGECDLLDRIAEWVDHAALRHAPEKVLQRFLEMDACSDAQMIAFMKGLERQGTRQIIATNNEARRADYIMGEMGFARRVERMFASGPMGIEKPDPRYFQHISDALAVAPDQIFFVDDREDNVMAARAMGWKAFHFTDDTRADLPKAMAAAGLSELSMPAPADVRLATYGTLAPGQVNHHQMDGMTGTWMPGKLRGRLFQDGWGAALNCPGFVLDSSGEDVTVQIFESADLPDHWDRLDAFEGAQYKRISTAAQTDQGAVEVSLYQVVI